MPYVSDIKSFACDMDRTASLLCIDRSIDGVAVEAYVKLVLLMLLALFALDMLVCVLVRIPAAKRQFV